MALTSGALRPLKTSISTQEDGGVEFSIRVLSAIKAKQEEDNHRKSEKKRTGRDFNPFLPYDPLMYVTSFQPHHVGLLNKFPVLDRHLLIVTRHFEHQTSLLNVVPVKGYTYIVVFRAEQKFVFRLIQIILKIGRNRRTQIFASYK